MGPPFNYSRGVVSNIREIRNQGILDAASNKKTYLYGRFFYCTPLPYKPNSVCSKTTRYTFIWDVSRDTPQAALTLTEGQSTRLCTQVRI